MGRFDYFRKALKVKVKVQVILKKTVVLNGIILARLRGYFEGTVNTMKHENKLFIRPIMRLLLYFRFLLHC